MKRQKERVRDVITNDPNQFKPLAHNTDTLDSPVRLEFLHLQPLLPDCDSSRYIACVDRIYVEACRGVDHNRLVIALDIHAVWRSQKRFSLSSLALNDSERSIVRGSGPQYSGSPGKHFLRHC